MSDTTAKVDVVGIGSCTVDYFAVVPRLGVSTGWLGLLGDDPNGLLIQKAFTEDRMDLSGLEIVKGEHSSLTWIPVDVAGERCIYMFPNVTGKISVYQVLHRFAPHIQAAKHFHTEASQLPIAPVKEAMQVAHDAKVRVIFDLDVSPSFFAESNLGTQDELCTALSLVDVLKPCKAAARELTGEADYEKVATALLRMGPSVVAITLGADGCLIATPKEVAKVPAFKVDVVDTTGAGDAFMGGLSYALLQGWDCQKVGLFANACAALCCTKIGARAMAKHDEVVALIKQQNPKGAAAF